MAWFVELLVTVSASACDWSHRSADPQLQEKFHSPPVVLPLFMLISLGCGSKTALAYFVVVVVVASV